MTTLLNTMSANGNDDRTEMIAQARRLSALNDHFETLSPIEILEEALGSDDFGKCALVSSFGAESGVLLHMVSQVAPSTPIILLNTGKLFGETLQYAAQLQHRIGLEDIRYQAPQRKDIEERDPLGKLSGTDPDACCAMRKTSVLERALEPFTSWINGRKRYQTDTRSLMSIVERDKGRLKLNPLANFTPSDMAEYHQKHQLPDHPLLSKGYKSIGCFPCTSKVSDDDDPRSGRWNGLDKTECGIH